MRKLLTNANLALLVSLICAVGLLAYARGLLITNNGRANHDQARSVAQLSYIGGEVKAKRALGLDWSEASKKMGLATRDKVRTGSKSNAAVGLKDGTEIKMRARSLLIIRASSASLAKGTMDVDSAGSDFVIDAGGKKIRLRKRDVDFFQ